ncbi:MAG: DUF4126 domain-containing protein [Nitrospinota bacterium]|nr:DUF4126 domain-containing protein [Nitrospinota bacterium]
MDIVDHIALSMGVAWTCGINLYATVAVLGIMGATGHVVLPEQLAVLQSPEVIAIAAFMYCVEFFADKTPGVDSAWDAVHSFIRIPAGAVIAAQAMAPVSQEAQFIAFLLGGAITTSAHGTKAATRLMINTSPEPFSNWIASITEDVAAIGALWVTFNHPYVIIAFVIAFFIFALWITPKIFRAFKVIIGKLAEFFSQKKESPSATPEPPTSMASDDGVSSGGPQTGS